MDTPNNQVGVRSWLQQRVAANGGNPQALRLDVRVEPVMLPPDPGEHDEATRDAWHRWEWWYVRCRVSITLVDDATTRRLELGSAEVEGVVEGQQPGRPFINVWEDYLPGWENLTQAAVADAERTLAALQGVSVAWTDTTVDQPVSGSLPGC